MSRYPFDWFTEGEQTPYIVIVSEEQAELLKAQDPVQWKSLLDSGHLRVIARITLKEQIKTLDKN
jgi:hypothetical protein